MEVGGKSEDVTETQEEGSFENEAVTKSVKKGLSGEKLEGRKN